MEFKHFLWELIIDDIDLIPFMKIIHIIFLSIVYTLLNGCNAFGQGNNLVVYNDCGQKFTLLLNGKKYAEEANTYFKVEDLNESKYNLQLLFSNEKLRPINKEVVFKSKGQQQTYTLKYLKGKFKLSKAIVGPLSDSIQGQPSPFPLPNARNK